MFGSCREICQSWIALQAAATFAAGKCLGGTTSLSSADVLKVAAHFEQWLKGGVEA